MHDILDLKTFPLDQPDTPAYADLVADCKNDLARNGMFNLTGFLKPDVAQQIAKGLEPTFASDAFTHSRQHNIYFRKDVPDVAVDHPALRQFETINHTLCADQIEGNQILDVYRFAPLANFLARVMEKPKLFTMDDPLACTNLMAYHEGEALNWHFDRSEFTTTLLLQAPEAGCEFEYRSDLRTDSDPNYDGVANLLAGQDMDVRSLTLSAGTLNVFRGKNTAHRITPVQGQTTRIIAVFSYYETPGVVFSDEDRIGFFGRAS